MKAENKHSIMVWAIVALAILNISTLVTIVYHNHKTETVQIPGSNTQKQLETDTEKFSGRYFRDQLGLSGNQMDSFREFNRSFRMQAREITITLTRQRKAMLTEMASLNSDTAKLNMLSDSIGILHSKLKRLTYSYYLDIKNICDAEQQKKLEQLFTEMFANDSQMAFPGHGRMRMQQMNGKNHPGNPN